MGTRAINIVLYENIFIVCPFTKYTIFEGQQSTWEDIYSPKNNVESFCWIFLNLIPWVEHWTESFKCFLKFRKIFCVSQSQTDIHWFDALPLTFLSQYQISNFSTQWAKYEWSKIQLTLASQWAHWYSTFRDGHIVEISEDLQIASSRLIHLITIIDNKMMHKLRRQARGDFQWLSLCTQCISQDLTLFHHKMQFLLCPALAQWPAAQQCSVADNLGPSFWVFSSSQTLSLQH